MQDKLCTIAALAIAALLGCDAPSDDPSFRVVPIGYWTDGDDGCSGFYLKTESGSMCLPPCESAPCQVPQVDMCGHQAGDLPICLTNDFCAYACESDGDCLTGQRCDGESDLCVWENEPPPASTLPPLPGEWSLCAGANYTCEGACVQTDIGELCAPTCQIDSDCTGPINECSENAPSTCIDGACVLPCDDNGGCWGIDRLTCDADDNRCVVAY